MSILQIILKKKRLRLDVPLALELTWDDILNVPVADASSVSDWNTFFDLPTNGNPFTSVEVSVNTVRLIGGSSITLRENLFGSIYSTHLISVIDNIDCVIACDNYAFYIETETEELICDNLTTLILPACVTMGEGSVTDCIILSEVDFSSLTEIGNSCFTIDSSLVDPDFPLLVSAGDDAFTYCGFINPSFPNLVTAGAYCFSGMESLLTINLPMLESIGDNAFGGCINITEINIPSCLTLGSTIGNDNVFSSIVGQNITLTIPHAIESDGDIIALKAANTVTVVYSD